MADRDFTITSEGSGVYLATMQSDDALEGKAQARVRLVQAAEASGGKLTDDEATARATVSYLMEHQDGVDLPAEVEIVDVLAAYPEAADEIAARRG